MIGQVTPSELATAADSVNRPAYFSQRFMSVASILPSVVAALCFIGIEPLNALVYGQASVPPRVSASKSRASKSTSTKRETGLVYVVNETLIPVRIQIEELIEADGKTRTFEGVTWTISPGTSKITRKGSELIGSEVTIQVVGTDVTKTRYRPDKSGRLVVTITDETIVLDKLPRLRSNEDQSFRSAVAKANTAANGSTSKRDGLIAEAIQKSAEAAAEAKAARERVSKSSSRYGSFVKDATWEYACAFHKLAREERRSENGAARSRARPFTEVHGCRQQNDRLVRLTLEPPSEEASRVLAGW